MLSVSAIIPTIGRASLRPAVESVLNQKNCDAEAIVVLDRPDRLAATKEFLEGLEHTLLITDGRGAPTARNAGLAAATADFVGYLDDDDLWFPDKTVRQVEAISRAPEPSQTFSVARSRLLSQEGTLNSDISRKYDPTRQSFPNFLVERRYFRHRSPSFNTPSLLGPRQLMTSILWDTELRKHQDWDLLIRFMAEPNVYWIALDEPLVDVYQGSPMSISVSSNWRHGEAFLTKHSDQITGRSRADFVLVQVLRHALREGSAEGLKYAISHLGWHPPHLAAVIRCFAGWVLRR